MGAHRSPIRSKPEAEAALVTPPRGATGLAWNGKRRIGQADSQRFTSRRLGRFEKRFGEQFDPCYHLFCDTLSSILDAPPADVLEDPADAAKMQGGGERSMRQFLPAMTDSIWHFAKAKDPLPARTTSASATRQLQAKMTERSSRFKFRGHELARQR